jgi:rhodanese-related sulfurtransferase
MDAIRPAALRQAIGSDQPLLVIDVRRNERFREASDVIHGALRRDPERVEEWAKTLPSSAAVVVYCVHGHEVSQAVAKSLGAKYLVGGIEAWRETGGELFHKPINSFSRWVTRERPKIDRIACPWLIRRFIDPEASFLFVPTERVFDTVKVTGATAYDIPGSEPFSHEGELCSFDLFLRVYGIEDPALNDLAVIVRGADTSRPELAPQSPGLLALSLGLSANFANDHEMLEHGLTMYDAFYAWCRSCQDEKHNWTPPAA